MNKDTESSETYNEILEHITQLHEKTKPVNHREVLKNLLNCIKGVDFQTEAGRDPEKGEPPTTKEYQIIAIDEVLKAAKQYKWGLCIKYDARWIFNGAYWKKTPEDDFKDFLYEAARKMGVPKLKVKHFTFKDGLYKQFQSAANLPTPNFDREVVKVNLQNCTFKVTPKDTQLDVFNRDDFLTYQLPFEYNQEARAPLFKRYLETVLPDESLRNILAEYIGYLFTRNLKLEKALILYGTGANGKSVFFDIINAMLGSENVSSYSLQSLTNDNGYYRAKITNKLVNYASEINSKLESSYFKQMVSGEPVEARNPYGEAFMAYDYAKLIFNCNELPRDVEHTNAFFRRFLIIPFDVTIPEEKQDKELAKKIIQSELPGVFNWVLEGLQRLVNRKQFTESKKSREALKVYKTESDSVAMFIEENEYVADFELKDVDSIPLKDIYSQYREYCYEDGYKPVSRKNFKARLKALRIDVKRTNQGLIVKVREKNKVF